MNLIKRISLIPLVILLVACESSFTRLGNAVIVDKSLSQSNLNIDASQFVASLLDAEELKESGDAINFHLISLGSASIPEARSFTLSGANMLIESSFDRDEEVDEFIANIQSGLEALTDAPHDQQLTQCYRTLLHTVSLLGSNAEKRRIYWVSDGIESSSILKMEKLEAFDYEEIKARFLADRPLPDLIGLEVILVCNDKSERAYKAATFWKQFLSEGGASVTLKSSLN